MIDVSLAVSIRKIVGSRRMILVSNRGPVQFEKQLNGELTIKRGAGGLITALDSVLKTTKALWIAAAITEGDKIRSRGDEMIPIPAKDPEYFINLIEMDPLMFDRYYNEISNKLLWFLQHYLFNTVYDPVFDENVKSAWHEGYVPANRLFAERIAALTRDVDDPIVMIQDYHLYLVAGELRRLKPRATLFHFLHVPWCCPDYMRMLPVEIRAPILQSLLENDIVGFHSWRYARNFINCCQEFLGHKIDRRHHRVFVGDRIVKAKAYPISISVPELTEFAASDAVKAAEAPLRKLRAHYKLIVRVDRGELSKNLVRGFDAFALMLRRRPELRKKVKFLAFAYPTREKVEEYRQYDQVFRERVKAINAEFGEDGWQPIDLEVSDNYARSIASLKLYDVLLTNPIYDGMNLVAKEGAVVNEDDGVIVLSENAGAFEEMRDGVLGVNPFDIEDTATKLEKALTMSPIERAARSVRLREIVVHNDILKWLLHQLKDIKAVKR